MVRGRTDSVTPSFAFTAPKCFLNSCTSRAGLFTRRCPRLAARPVPVESPSYFEARASTTLILPSMMSLFSDSIRARFAAPISAFVYFISLTPIPPFATP